MTTNARKETPLIERLRRSKSTAKTRFIARWPEIKQALDAGFTAKAIHTELSGDGLTMSYRRFVELVRELDPPVSTQSGAQEHPAAKSQPVRKPAQPEPAAIRRYVHNPVPDPKDLF